MKQSGASKKGRKLPSSEFEWPIVGDAAREKNLKLHQFSTEHAADAVYWMGPDANFIYVNNAACESLGYSRKELLGMSVHDIDPNFTKKIWPTHWKDLKKKGSFLIESQHRRKDGSLCPVSVSVNYLEFEGKEYNVAYARDISDSKEAEKKLSESEEKYRKLVETANDAILLADAETGILIDANKAAEVMLDRPRSEIIGTHQSSIHPEEEAPHYKNLFNQMLNGGIVLAYVCDTKGQEIPVQISATPMELHGKKVLMGVFRDITELKRVEDDLRKGSNGLKRTVSEKQEALRWVLKELEDAKRLSDIGALAGTVAHELRNPLGVINAALYNIKKKRTNDAIDSHVASIERKVSESNLIIQNLLSFAKMRPPVLEDINVTDILRECIEHCGKKRVGCSCLLEKKGVAKKKEIIEADATQMSELFSNLLNNACQSLESKSGKIQITTDHNKGENRLSVVVEDNGIGIDEKNMKKIFEPFFTTKSKGVGLGLTVCNQVVHLHGGTLKIESKKSVGTKVSVTLPITRR